MSLWKITNDKAQAIEETTFREVSILEAQIEGWVASNPELLGEPLLVFGRQVPVQGLGDTIDLLALDKDGSLVVIEIKRTDLRVPVDVQGLRYASYVCGWTLDDLEEVAAGYFDDDEDRSLEIRFQEFAEGEGVEEDTTLNEQQRVIIVGQTVRDRLGSVALWLRQQGVDIKLVEIHPFRDGGELYLEPVIIIPPPTADEWEAVGKKAGSTDRPWVRDGAAWHKSRSGEASFERSQLLIGVLEENGLTDTISYNQKHYISLKRGTRAWLRIVPRPSAIRVDVICKPRDFNVETLSDQLGLEIFSGERELKEKLALPSSVGSYSRNAYYCIRLRLKDDFDIQSEALLKFFREAAHKFD